MGEDEGEGLSKVPKEGTRGSMWCRWDQRKDVGLPTRDNDETEKDRRCFRYDVTFDEV